MHLRYLRQKRVCFKYFLLQLEYKVQAYVNNLAVQKLYKMNNPVQQSLYKCKHARNCAIMTKNISIEITTMQQQHVFDRQLGNTLIIQQYVK